MVLRIQTQSSQPHSNTGWLRGAQAVSDWKSWPLSDSMGCAALCLPVPFSPLGDSTWGELYLVTLGMH